MDFSAENIIWMGLIAFNFILLFLTNFKMKWFVFAYIFYSVSSMALSRFIIGNIGFESWFMLLILLNFFIIVCFVKQGSFAGKPYLLLFLWVQIATYFIAQFVDMRAFIFHGYGRYEIEWMPFNLLEWQKKIELLMGVVNGVAIFNNRKSGNFLSDRLSSIYNLYFKENGKKRSKDKFIKAKH